MARNTHSSLQGLAIGILSLFAFQLSAQNNFVHQWDHRYGGMMNEHLEVLLQTTDHGFLMAGSSLSTNDGDKSQPSRGLLDYYVVKTDANGLKLWDARFGGALDDELFSAQQTSDGGFILGGYSKSGNDGDKTQPNWDNTTHNYADYWVVKIDGNGNKQWDKRYGGIYEDKLMSVIQTIDGGYLLGGFSESSISGDRTETSRGGPDYWIVKTDATGNKLWDKRFGGNRNEQLKSVIQTSDGNYVLGGFTWSDPVGDNTQSCRGPINYCDYWIVKVDATGNKMWDQRYGGAANDNLVSMYECSDHGLIIGGYSYSSVGGEKSENNYGAANTADYWLVKTDALGNKVWDKTIGGNLNEEELGDVYQTSDGGFFVSGSSYSNVNGDKTERNLGGEQSWVIKLDGNGNVKWDKTIFNPGHDETGIGILLDNGSIVLANVSNGGIGGYKTEMTYDPSQITYDFWIVKLQNAVLPIAEFATSNENVCTKNCIDFQNTSLFGNSYEWYFPGGSPSTSNAQYPTNICYDVAGTYNVTLIVQNDIGTDTLLMPNYIHVLQASNPINISSINDTLYAPQGFVSYEWYLNNVPIVFSNNYYFVPQQPGNYSVSAIDQNGCSIVANINDVILKTDQLDKNVSSATLFPNPAQDNFVIRYHFTQHEKSVSIDIYDAISKLVYHDVVNGTADEMHYIVETAKLNSGIYRVSIQSGNEQINKNIVIQRE